MRIPIRWILLGGLLWWAMMAPPVWAAEPELELGRPAIVDDQVVVDVQLRGFFRENSLDALESGTPATLLFRWSLHEEKPGWRDPVIEEGTVRNRIFFDVLEEQYHLFNHQGRPLGACEALEGLTETLCRREAMVLTEAGSLEEGSRYYVVMEVTLEILSDQQVRGLESWLLGEETSDSAVLEVELEDSDGISGLALGLAKKIAGLKTAKAKGESPVFSGE